MVSPYSDMRKLEIAKIFPIDFYFRICYVIHNIFVALFFPQVTLSYPIHLSQTEYNRLTAPFHPCSCHKEDIDERSAT